MGKDVDESNSQPSVPHVTVVDDVTAVAPFECVACGHTFMVPVKASTSKCPFCGACVECV